jgi:hypothetical protein
MEGLIEKLKKIISEVFYNPEIKIEIEKPDKEAGPEVIGWIKILVVIKYNEIFHPTLRINCCCKKKEKEIVITYVRIAYEYTLGEYYYYIHKRAEELEEKFKEIAKEVWVYDYRY